MAKPAKGFDVARQNSAPGASTDASQIAGSLIDSVPAILWRADPRTLQFTFVSSYAETLLGYPTRRWINEPLFWQDHIYREDKSVIAARADALKNTGMFDLEYRMIAADGRALWVRDMGHAVPGEGPRREVAGIIVDLSRKRTEKGGFDKSKLWLRQIIDTIPQRIWSAPADGSIDFWNARCLSEMGLSPAELQGDSWQRLLHPDDRDRAVNAWRESVRNGTPYEQTERLRVADGQFRWFLARAVPLRDEQGRVLRWYGTSTDIEDQKRAEDELRRQGQLWRAVFDNAYIGIAIHDSSGHFIAVNSVFEKLSGYSLEKLRGMTCLDLVHEETRRDYEALKDELQAGKRDRAEMELQYVRNDGEIVWVRAHGSVLPAPPGEPRLTVLVIEDITERKRLWADLQRQNDRLRTLLDVTHRLIARLDVSSVVETVLTVLQQRERWDVVEIVLPDTSTDRLKVYRLDATKRLTQNGQTIPVDGSISGQVYRSGQRFVLRSEDLPVLTTKYGFAPWVRDTLREAGLISGCFFPLIYDGRAVGVLVLGSCAKRDCPDTEIDYLQEVARSVAVVLDNALRFDAVSVSQERLASERHYTDEELRAVFDFEHIIGRSKVMRAVLQQVQTVAPTDSAVLILGETGTGKELIARAIHDRSPRKDQPFIKVDCAAIPAALMESELFGYEKGAFTGAISQKLGRLEIADRGTLFLDEIGDLPLELQTKLLRVLQDRAFERLGSHRTLHLDLRVIAATNRDLAQMVAKGEFRADLYYRLKVFPIVIPPLRERPEDIPPLVWHYVHKYAQRLKKTIDTIPIEAMQAFKRYPWPGNVRELQHFMERSVVLSSGNVLQAPLGALEQDGRTHPGSGPRVTKKRTMEEVERETILEALRESNWVVGGPTGAARRLGLKRTTLASRMERLGIRSPGGHRAAP